MTSQAPSARILFLHSPVCQTPSTTRAPPTDAEKYAASASPLGIVQTTPAGARLTRPQGWVSSVTPSAATNEPAEERTSPLRPFLFTDHTSGSRGCELYSLLSPGIQYSSDKTAFVLIWKGSI